MGRSDWTLLTTSVSPLASSDMYVLRSNRASAGIQCTAPCSQSLAITVTNSHAKNIISRIFCHCEIALINWYCRNVKLRHGYKFAAAKLQICVYQMNGVTLGATLLNNHSIAKDVPIVCPKSMIGRSQKFFLVRMPL
jgi:hypothetical protein